MGQEGGKFKNVKIFPDDSRYNSMEDVGRKAGSGPSTSKPRQNPGSRPSTFDVYEGHLRDRVLSLHLVFQIHSHGHN